MTLAQVVLCLSRSIFCDRAKYGVNRFILGVLMIGFAILLSTFGDPGVYSGARIRSQYFLLKNYKTPVNRFSLNEIRTQNLYISLL